MKMIKRLNQYILSKIMGIRLRPTGAVFLGGFAGLSLTASVLPTVISILGVTDSFSARIDLAGLAVYAFISWAVGGWAAQRTASAHLGAVILGLVGLVSAAFFSVMTYGAESELLLLLCAAAGLAYGSFGGMLIAVALRETNGASAD
ncbi:MAG: hypothetical protein J5X23_02750 [Candidatus Accumulibacter sp.]|uniref:hypothetical protein n=1 Tax=Accumulibacter sp. TaxID=2053492 RepID=UPI001B1406C8|nr:hypothetical protein [Accumulibacter sp.]MBO3713918.1 hypothetical protein [Accumulibacter sp.]